MAQSTSIEILGLDLARLIADAEGVAGPSARGRLNRLTSELNQTRFTVATVGEFKRGKSSLVNALVRRSDLLPVDVDISTSIPTTVTYGDTERAVVRFRDGTDRAIGTDQLGEYASERGNAQNHLGVSLVSVELPDEGLRGVTYADTPGLNSINLEHTALTRRYVRLADVVLFVTSTDDPLNTEELKFLAELSPVSGALVVAVTKIELAPDPQAFLADVTEKISATLKSTSFDVVGVSPALMIDGLLDDDPESIENSNIDALRAAIEMAIDRSARAPIVLRAAEQTDEELELIAGPLEAELAALSTQDRDREREIGGELRRLRTRHEDVADLQAGWRDALRISLDELVADVQRAFAERIEATEHNLEACLLDPLMLERPAEIGRQIVQEVEVALADAGKRLTLGASAITLDIRAQTSVEVTPPSIRKLSFKPIGGLPNTIPQQRLSMARKLVEAGKNAVSGGVTYKKVAALVFGGVVSAVSAAVATPIVLVAGSATVGGLAAVGALASAKNGVEQAEAAGEDERAQILRRFLTQYLNDNAAQAKQEVRDSSEAFRQEIVDQVDSRLRRERTSIDESITRVNAAADATVDESRKSVLAQRLKEVEQLRERASELIGKVASDGVMPPRADLDLEPVTEST